MGEAKRRGTREERVAAAKKRNAKVFRHYGVDPLTVTRAQISKLNNAWHKLTKEQQKEAISKPAKEEKDE